MNSDDYSLSHVNKLDLVILKNSIYVLYFPKYTYTFFDISKVLICNKAFY